MSITVKFDGRYNRQFVSVSPNDITIMGRRLCIRGAQIPIEDNYIYPLFELLEKRSRRLCGKITIAIRNDSIEYCDKTHENYADWLLDRTLGFGVQESYWGLRPSTYVPNKDEYREGQFTDSYY